MTHPLTPHSLVGLSVAAEPEPLGPPAISPAVIYLVNMHPVRHGFKSVETGFKNWWLATRLHRVQLLYSDLQPLR